MSCNGPEAAPRNSPADPVCICDVYADRMIALQPKAEFSQACAPPVWSRDGSHNDPVCNCTGPSGARSKWEISAKSARFVGRMPTWIPYFYFQTPRGTYPGARQNGDNWSTPKNGSCPDGAALGDGGCSWRRLPAAAVIAGAELLALGWNATAVSHWPLREYGPNTTEQYATNLPVFKAAWARLGALVAQRCCGC